MRIAFLYNAQDHQILHSLPIACKLSEIGEDCEVTVLAGTDEQTSLCRTLAATYPQHRLRFDRLRSPKLLAWLKRRIRTPKLLILWSNRAKLASFDALVVPERTTLFLKKMSVRLPKFIHTSHGSGGHDRSEDPRLREFDLLLVPNEGRLRRIAAAGNVRRGAAAVIGYVKFDLVQRLGQRRRRLFSDDRPVILYNPHHRADTTSWHKMGLEVLDYFANQESYNLIFAPHVRLFDPPARHLSTFARYEGINNIHIDLGSARSIDMSYTFAADIYLGDVSSQVLEFVGQPRPCIFLNPRKFAVSDDSSFPYWGLGPVVESIAGIEAALASRESWLAAYIPAQERAFAAAFPSLDQPAPERAARAIASFLREGRLPDDIVAA